MREFHERVFIDFFFYHVCKWLLTNFIFYENLRWSRLKDLLIEKSWEVPLCRRAQSSFFVYALFQPYSGSNLGEAILQSFSFDNPKINRWNLQSRFDWNISNNSCLSNTEFKIRPELEINQVDNMSKGQLNHPLHSISLGDDSSGVGLATNSIRVISIWPSDPIRL